MPEMNSARIKKEDQNGGWWRYRYLIAAILFIAYSIQYLDRIKTTALIPLIRVSINLSYADIGNGIFLMMVFYGPAQFVSGMLCDRYGPKKVLVFSLVSWITLTVWMAYMQTSVEWYVRSAIFGLTVGTEFVPSARLLARWFPPKQRAQAQSTLSWAWILTPAWAAIVATQLATFFGDWRPVFLVVAAIAVLPLVLILMFIKDRPEACKSVSECELQESYADELAEGTMMTKNIKERTLSDEVRNRYKIPLWTILTTPGFIAVTLIDVTMQMTFWGVIAWSPTYLKEVFKFSLVNMGYWASVYFAAGVLGSFVSSWVSDNIFHGKRRPMIAMCFLGTIPCILILSQLPPGVSQFSLLAVLAGAGFFANMGWGPFLAWPADVFSAEVYGKAMGFMQMFGYIGGAFCPLIMSRLIRTTPTGADYTYSWIFVACCAFAGLLCAFMVRDKKMPAPQLKRQS
jgi:sugar phosphate permease